MNTLAEVVRQLNTSALPLEPLPVESERIKQAAVTILLREEQGIPEILIIQRAERPGDPWSGHLALPGGRADAEDANLIFTAARETWEEVGIPLVAEEHFIGRLQTLLPKNARLPQIEITPLIALAPAEIELRLNEEVAAAFWLPIHELQAGGLSDIYRMPLGETIIKYPAYPSPNGPIWGITERILTEFLGLLSNAQE